MSIYTRARNEPKERFLSPERLEAWDTWSRRPMSGAASWIVPAVIGSLFFLVLFIAYMIA